MNYINSFWIAVGFATVAAVCLCLVVRCADFIPARHRKVAMKLMAVAGVVGIAWAALKPSIEWPRGVTNHDSAFDTNSWAYVDIAWKLGEDYPLDVLFTIEAKPKSGGDYAPVQTCYSGDCSNRVTATTLGGNPTNFTYRVTSEYEPGTVSIKDLFAVANTNNLSVTCRWTCPAELVGLSGRIMCRKLDEVSTWHLERVVPMQATNVVTLVGNFVNGRLDREFCVVVNGYTPMMIRNVMDRKLKSYRRLHFAINEMPRIKREMNILKSNKAFGG